MLILSEAEWLLAGLALGVLGWGSIETGRNLARALIRFVDRHRPRPHA